MNSENVGEAAGIRGLVDAPDTSPERVDEAEKNRRERAARVELAKGFDTALASDAGRDYRKAILEDAAKVAEREIHIDADPLTNQCASDIAASIRALKEKP